MGYRKNYKRRSILSRKIIASSLSATFCAGTFSGSYAGATQHVISLPVLSENEKNPMMSALDAKIKAGEIYTEGVGEKGLGLIKNTYLKYKSVFPGAKKILKLVFNYLSEKQLDDLIQKFPQYLSDDNLLFQIVRANNSGEHVLRYLFTNVNGEKINAQQLETLKAALFYNEDFKKEVQRILEGISIAINVDQNFKDHLEDLVNKNKEVLLSKMPSKSEFLKLFTDEEKFNSVINKVAKNSREKLRNSCPGKAQILSAAVGKYFEQGCMTSEDVDQKWKHFMNFVNNKPALEKYIKERIDVKNKFKQFFDSLEYILSSKNEEGKDNFGENSLKDSKINTENIKEMDLNYEEEIVKKDIFSENDKHRLLKRKNVIFIIGVAVVLLLIVGCAAYLVTRNSDGKEIDRGSDNNSDSKQINNQDTSPVAQKTDGRNSESGQISGEGSDISKRYVCTAIGSSLGVVGAFLDDKISEHNAKGVKKVKDTQNAVK